jgi:hypothetical protein
VERKEAEARGLVEFKFDNNDEMLRAMRLGMPSTSHNNYDR